MILFEFVLSLALWLVNLLQPIVVPLCFLLAWGLVGMSVWSVWCACRDGVKNTRRMHQIPCANCQFFTGDYHLKCAVRPDIALSESAIGCRDYEPF
ncbi:MAG: hypothetical protein HC895_09630 [Leptolyngbyaceae cyanobacterium SM1_3_5]|nr:hypothetical protein [Leptolyngbyaceae cyanobacterium SM1_3_5]